MNNIKIWKLIINIYIIYLIYRNVKLFKFPIDDGISPLKLLLLKSLF